MRTGTKSLLFGVHAFWLHPLFVALAWWKLYGFSRVRLSMFTGAEHTTSLWDWKLWLAFLVHDWGYWGCEKMDDTKGEEHPLVGARIVERVTGGGFAWWYFIAGHSRFLAKRFAGPVSALCYADKLSFCVTPWWVYLPMANASGEVREYMDAALNATKYQGEGKVLTSQRDWHRSCGDFIQRWVDEHKDGRDDTWTRPSTGGDK